jgi:hypothetical protein
MAAPLLFFLHYVFAELVSQSSVLLDTLMIEPCTFRGYHVVGE